MDNIQSFVSKYNLRISLDNKTLLFSYLLLMVINFMVVGEYIFNNVQIYDDRIKMYYGAIIIAIIINLLLINFGMKSTEQEIAIFSKQYSSKLVFIVFTFLQCMIALLTIVLFINSTNFNSNVQAKKKAIIIAELIIINFVTITFSWSYATTSCGIVNK